MVVLSGAVPSWCGSPKSDFKPRKMMKNLEKSWEIWWEMGF
jgi:hypothetical protein